MSFTFTADITPGGTLAFYSNACTSLSNGNRPAPPPSPPRRAAVAGVTGPRAACPGTSLPLTSVAAVKKAVFEESAPRGVTVGSTLNRCSYGITKLTTANSLVAPLVNLPCNGTT